MLTEDIPLIQKTYDLYKTFYQLSPNFPKKDRFGIGQRCENYLLTLIEGVIKASKSNKTQKMTILHEVSVKLDMLKIFIRLLKDLLIIDLKKYTLLQEKLHEVGKMLGGWIKSLN